MITRRSMLLALPAALGCSGLPRSAWALTADGAKRVAVVFPPALEPCAEAVEGLRARLSGNGVAVDLLDVNQATYAADIAEEVLRRPAVVVAVGSDAVRAVLGRESAGKIVSTMTLEADRAGGTGEAGRLNAAVYLDIPLRTLVAEVRKIFPERTRIGVIRNPGRRGVASQIRSQVADPGSLQVAECASADQLLPVFLSFRKKVDFVICLPDGSLYNSTTARPLIMASLENRLPIVGFSPAFLRAGAAVAIYPDYRGIGQQTADLVRRCLEPGDCTAWEAPRKVDVAVNARVLRMLGIECRTAANSDLVILR
ncbi:MAG TPA: ABC transporter substrate binding protein [Bryobacteraceae bacterium]|nr:ABC transporter substrate binding protein [Bryobacteraceae bacterium]